GGVLVLRRVAAADVAALEAEAEVDPGVAHLQAFLAAVRRVGGAVVLRGRDGVQVFAGHGDIVSRITGLLGRAGEGKSDEEGRRAKEEGRRANGESESLLLRPSSFALFCAL